MIQGRYSGVQQGTQSGYSQGNVGYSRGTIRVQGYSRVSEWERSHSLYVSRRQIPRVFSRVDREQAVIIIIDCI